MKRRLLAALLCTLFSAAAGRDDASELARLSGEYWEGYLRAHPREATALGDHRYDHLLEDLSSEGLRAEAGRLGEVLRRALAMDRAALSFRDRLTLESLILDAGSELARIDCHLEEWVVDPLHGPAVEFQNLPTYHPVATAAAATAYLARCRAMPKYLAHHTANLDRGLRKGRVAVRSAVTKAIHQLDQLLALEDAAWPLVAPGRKPVPGWSDSERGEFCRALEATVRGELRPALARYLASLKETVLPAARAEQQAGVGQIPGGSDDYTRLIRIHTTLDLTADEVHRIGVEAVAGIDAEMEALGRKLFGGMTRQEMLRRMRGDAALHFATAPEVARKAAESLARAQAAVPRWFGLLPRAACTVEPMGPHEAEHSTIAYYRAPASDGSRPGRYYINTTHPTTRPRYEAEVLAFHEAVPGHHLQIALAQERDDLPRFRKHMGVTAYVEGWALYTERLCDEMGLYSSDLDRMGMLSFDAWRASRLVVDTGMHARGWSREAAIAFMIEHSALAPNNIANEVDRYITWPGQALAYKLGAIEFRRLRRRAESQLGDKFDIRWFHDTVLRHGALGMESLRLVVDEAIAARAAAGGGE